MSDNQEILEAIAKLTAEMNAVGLVASEAVAAACRRGPAPISEFQRIEGKVTEALDDLYAALPSSPNHAQMLKWSRERVKLLLTHAHWHI